MATTVVLNRYNSYYRVLIGVIHVVRVHVINRFLPLPFLSFRLTLLIAIRIYLPTLSLGFLVLVSISLLPRAVIRL